MVKFCKSCIAAGTGSTFTLLPPDNASGNFVKVVQLCLQRNMSEDDLNTIRTLLLDFYNHYEKYCI